MNNKGFTLVELLATVVLVALVMGIASYGVINAINNSKKKSEDIFVKKFVQAIDSYLALNGPSLAETGNTINSDGKSLTELQSFKLSDLANENFIDKDKFINPKNKKDCYDANAEIKAYRDDNFVYYYSFDFKQLEDICDLNGDSKVFGDNSINNGDDFVDDGIIDEVIIEEETTEEANHGVPSSVSLSNLNLGAYILYKSSVDFYTVDSSLTGSSNSVVIRPSELKLWRVLRKNDDGTVDIISQYTSSTKIKFEGKVGYRKLVGSLNTVNEQYANSSYAVSGGYYVGYNGQTPYTSASYTYLGSSYSVFSPSRLLWYSSTDGECGSYQKDPDCYEPSGGGDILYEKDFNLIQSVLKNTVAKMVDTNTNTAYWLASRHFNGNKESTTRSFIARFISTDGSLATTALYYYSADQGSFISRSDNIAIRPIVRLKADLYCVSGNGNSSSPCSIDGTVG